MSVFTVCAVTLLCFCLFGSAPLSVLLLLLLSTLLLLDFRVVVDGGSTDVCSAVVEVTVVAVDDGVTPFEITSSCDLEGKAAQHKKTMVTIFINSRFMTVLPRAVFLNPF